MRYFKNRGRPLALIRFERCESERDGKYPEKGQSDTDARTHATTDGDKLSSDARTSQLSLLQFPDSEKKGAFPYKIR